MIVEASVDAIALANAALEDDFELSSTKHYHKMIDFGSFGAIEYFGGNIQNPKEQEKIQTTFYRSSITSSAFKWDWWQNRYVSYSCNDTLGPHNGGCIADSPAYIDQSGLRSDYPVIVFCAPFFNTLRSHAQQIAAINADESSQKKMNLRNLRSRGEIVGQILNTFLSRIKLK